MNKSLVLFTLITLLFQCTYLFAEQSSFYSLSSSNHVMTHEEETSADQQLYELEPVIVSASTMPLSLEELTSSITIITSKDIQAKKIHYLSELLNGQPSVDLITTGGIGQLSSVFIRGAASEQTLVLINGVAVYDPSSPARNTDIAQITLDNVERIEIVRGPQSILFGSSAMGGVVNIITKQARDTWRSRLSISGGTYQTLLTQLSSQGRLGQLGLALGLSLNNTQGFSAAKRSETFERQASQPLPVMDKDGSRNLSIDLNLDYDLNEKLDFKLNNRYITSDNELDNFGGDFGDDPNYQGQLKQLVNQLTTNHQLLSNWTQKLAVGLSQSDRTYINDSDSDHVGEASSSEWRSRNLSIDWRHEFKLPKANTLVVGSGYQQEQAMGHSIAEYDDWFTFSHVIEENNFDVRSAHHFNVYAEHNVRLGPWTSLAGIRLDNHDQFSEFWSFKISEAYQLKFTQTKFSASYGTAFKAPALYQLYVDDVYSTGNPNLRPEQSSNWEIGLNQPLFDKKMKVTLHYFQSKYSDQIDAPFNVSSFKYEYVNIKKVEIEGLEASLSANLVKDLNLTLHYNKLTANDVTNKETSGNDPLLRRADYKIGLDVNWQWEKLNLSLDLNYVGPRWDKVYDSTLFATVQKSLAPYTILNLAASYTIIDQLECFFKLHNVLDSEYELVSGYNTSRFNVILGTTLIIQ